MTAEEPRQKSASWPLYLIGSLFVIGTLCVIAWNIELPFIAYSAGPVSDAADSVVVEDVEFFPPQGELLMLTVVTQDVNVFEALIAGADPTVDLVRRQAVRREGETDEEYRNRVLQQMDDSNFRSIAVALRYLGYELVPSEVVINDIQPDVPAAEVLELGDTLRTLNGVDVASLEDVGPAMEGLVVGDIVSMGLERNGDPLEVQVELAAREDDPEVPMIGVVLGELSEPPFPIEIQAGDVGGPSAGMMHAIAVIDALTEGELTQGRIIAGTGTIDLEGNIGGIGGIRQKVVGAEAAGAEYILVPEANYESALTAERRSIEIVPVATLDDAITFLEGLPAA